MITQETIKERLHYDANTGLFRWRYSVVGGVQPWEEAGTLEKDGYIRIRVKGKSYLAHRLAWLYVTGEFPKKQIDHLNRVRDDNRIENLRDVSQSVNKQNNSGYATNTSGHAGVCWDKSMKKWRVQLMLNYKRLFFGYYDDFELACLVADEAKDKYHTKATKELTGYINENSSRLRNGLEAQ